MTDVFEHSLSRLLEYCRTEEWAGYDPYDALNSPLAHAPLLNNRFSRTALTQLVKRSPVNLRPLLGIRKGLNPKGLALAARALILIADRAGESLPGDLSARGNPQRDRVSSDLQFLMNRLSTLRHADSEDACWGYNFDWQSRAFFAPRGTPNAVCTVFAAHACLDWYERTGSEAVLNMATGACSFLLNRLNRSSDAAGECFSYTPLDHSKVHNVNLLVAELLARAAVVTGNDEYRDVARRSVEYTLSKQRSDGSWPYGEAASQSWIDSFHTGFIVVSLRNLIEYLRRDEWSEAFNEAYRFYESRFFLADGTPGYYHDRSNPHDIHSAAQGVVTFVEMADLMPKARERASRVLRWAIENLQDPRGFFYFQNHRLYTIKISYMRWAQTWMLYALSLFLSRSRIPEDV